jgi:hypothetical protein
MFKSKNIFRYAIGLFFFTFLILSVSTPVAMAANPWRGVNDTADSFAGGCGTEEEPYLISDPSELAFLALRVNAGDENYSDKHYKITEDLDLNGRSGHGWTPIGIHARDGRDFPFKGHLDGNGRTVSDLTRFFSSGEDKFPYTTVGLFGYIMGGSVSNLNVEKVLIGASSSYAGYNGAIAAWLCGGVIENCAVSGEMCNGDVNGLIVGRLWGDGTVKNSAACGSILDGGIVGKLEDGSVTGSVFINSGEYPRSGLVREIDRGTISNCFASDAGETGRPGKDGGCGTVYTSAAGVSILEIDDPTSGEDTVGLGGEWIFKRSYYPRPAGAAKSSLLAVRRITALAAVPIFFNKTDSASFVTGAFKIPTRTADGRKLKWKAIEGWNSPHPVVFDASGNVTFITPVEDEIILTAEDGPYKKKFIINVRVQEDGATFTLDIGELGLSDKVVRLERKKNYYQERYARFFDMARDILGSFGSSPEAAEKILGRPFYRTFEQDADVDGEPYNQVTLKYPGLKLSFGKFYSYLICESVSYATAGVKVGDSILDVIKKLGKYDWSWGQSIGYKDDAALYSWPETRWLVLRFDPNGKIYKIESYWYLHQFNTI